MLRAALWGVALGGIGLVGCSSGPAGPAANGDAGTSAKSLVGTWDVTTTPTGTGGVATTVIIGQDSLTVTSPSFVLTAVRTGNALTFDDDQSPDAPNDSIALTATQTAAAFDAGIVPFDLGGSWAMQIVPNGQGTVTTCTLAVSATEIDGSCHKITAGFDFTFTTAKTASAASSFGDLGGTWTNTWIWPGASGGTFPCRLDFTGSSVTTCPTTAADGAVTQSPLAGITFTYDGANTVSGAAQGWAEFSATRR